jgi:predicted nucleotide-binding protein (sugar kinase/HSP70/actin superfamily)
MKRKIGIPKILWYYEYYPFWDVFFENLGLEVITSEDTNREILKKSINIGIDELCLPTKLAYGHILNLKDRTDYIFLPYISSSLRNSYNCPNFSGLPDIIRHSSLNISSNINCFIDCNIESFISSIFKLGLSFTKNPKKIFFAYIKAINKWREYKKNSYIQELFKETSNLRIGILSHPYILNDPLLGRTIINILKKMKVFIIHNEMIQDISLSHIRIPKGIMWESERKMLKCFYLFKELSIDGIINITSFSCGPDAVVSEILHSETKEKNIPFLQLVIDENFQENVIFTRIEPFVELIRRRSK